jgi:hypothetical protein
VRGRHRNQQRLSAGVRLVAAAAAVIAVVSGTWAGYKLLSEPACGAEIRISVAAVPEIAPAVQATAADWAREARVADRCVAVDVVAADSADVAAAVAGQHGATLNGVGQASGRTKVPDAWIADSSIWNQRLRLLGQDWVPAEAPPVARSHVVIAMPEPIAATLGWPNAKVSSAELLKRMTTSAQLRTGIVEPNRDASGVSGLLAMAAAAQAAGGANAQQATIGALRSLAAGRSALRADLLARFPRAADPASLGTALGAAPLSEQAVISYNAAQPPVRIAPVFLEPPPTPLDYPYTILPGLSPEKSAAAAALRAALAGDTYRNRLAAQGLRAADGSTGEGFPPVPGAPGASQPLAPPDAAIVDRTLSTWSVVSLPGRMLAVIDVSGSMTAPVPGAGGATRSQVTVEAARRGLGLFDDSWAAGLWTFSTLLDGANDHKELAPIGPVSSQRTNLLAALASIKPKPGGQTGLYDTILASYKEVKEGWDPGRHNTVVIMTDGENQDDQGLSLDQLLAELQKVVDPAKPVHLVIIGIGPDVSPATLQKIPPVTGGGVFIAEDPTKIGDIFLRALALRGA